jgi:hypothetical protein
MRVRYPGAVLRRPKSKGVGLNPWLWLIGSVGGLVGLGFLVRSHTQHRGLRTGTQLGAPNSVTVVTDPMASGYDEGPVSLRNPQELCPLRPTLPLSIA